VTLRVGSTFGSYQILAAIGAGGMGEVYRARDTKRDRDVAIKVLPEAFNRNPDRLARFRREARALAAINHPNIAAIYGFEESEGVHALVLELVEGLTLADKLAHGSGPKAPAALQLDEALPIARQIAEALDAAHEKGIVHRDLKPANVKVTPAGMVKVLDFGLAKTHTDAGDLTNAHTETAVASESGVLLGTVPYMSPEQARGQAVDKRTDIWAFGCVLYELLTGRRAFHEPTSSDTIAAILERPPDWAALPSTTPAAVRRLLTHCLEKDVRRRLRDIGDARLELDEPLVDVASLAVPAGRVSDVVFSRLTDFVGMKESPAMSPDGKMVAFVAFVDGKRQIWLRMLAGGVPLQLTRDDVDHEYPRWAPDSSALIYYTPAAKHGEQGTIWEIGALGGWPRKVTPALAGGDISHDGRRIAVFQASDDQPALVTVARDGSGVELVARVPSRESYRSPRWSPDDRSIAFERSSTAGTQVSVEIVSLATGSRRTVCHGTVLKGFCWLVDGSGLVYSSSLGSTIFYRPSLNLRAISVDGSRDRQLTFGDQSYADPDTNRAGLLIASRISCASDVWKIPTQGSPAENTERAVRITAQTGQVRTPSPSPDDREVVYLSDNGGHGNLWVAKTDGSAVRQITFERDPRVGIGLPKWSPAGDVIVFVTTRGEQIGLSAVHPDGGGLRPLVADARAPSWSGDGRWLYYESMASGCLEKIRPEGGEPVVIRPEGGNSLPVAAPDGTAVYHITSVRSNIFGLELSDKLICGARPEGGSSETLASVRGDRIPGSPRFIDLVLSPDGQWLAMTLADGATSNAWVLPTAGGVMRPITDFGSRSIEIARSFSWSPDGHSIYAAIGELDADIVLIDGLIP
jgi:eukaryotic-like serine/threonine-protein kinase